MPIAGGISLIVAGAILSFAITTRPVQGVDLGIVGVILMLAGAAALLLPVLTRNRTRPDPLAGYGSQDIADDSSLTVEDSSSVRRYTRQPESDRRVL